MNRKTRKYWIYFSIVVALVAAAASFVDPVATVGVLAAAGVWVLANTTRCDPVTLLSIDIFLLVLVPSRYVFKPLGAVGTPAVLVGLIAAGWWTASRLVPSLSRSASGFQPMRVGVLLFGWATALTYGWAFMRPLNGLESRAADRALIALIALCGLTLLAADGIGSRERFERLLRRFVLAGVILAAFGIMQFTTGVDPSQLLKFPGLQLAGDLRPIQEGGAVRRVASTALHPIEFGVVLTMALPIALHYAFHAPRDRRTRQWLSVVVIAVAVPMSVSRSAIVGIVVALLVQFRGWDWRRRLNVAGSLAVLAGAMQAVVPGLLGTIKSQILNVSSDPSVQGRTDDYGPIFDLWHKSPWLGRGLGTFDPGTYRYLDNQYLGTLIDSGVIGLTVLILLFLIAMGTARGARRRSSHPESADLARALLASVAAAAATFATFDALAFPMNAGILAILLGCIGALWRFAYLDQRADAEGPTEAGVGQTATALPVPSEPAR